MADDHDLPAATVREIGSYVDDWLIENEVPGASVALVDADGVVYAQGFGARDLAENAPATPETLYGVGSVTKAFTSLAVLQLVEAGDLALDDPVADHVDLLREVPGDPVTVRELLTHTSGMPSDGSAVALIRRGVLGAGGDVPMASREDFRRHVDGAGDERVTDGERFFYYNSGYVVLGRVVEAVAGVPYTSYVEREILDPLGMERTTFDREDFEADDDAMTPYLQRDEDLEAAGFPFDEGVSAAGGLLAPVSELAAFVRLAIGGGAADGTRLVAGDLLAAAFERHATRSTFLDGSEEGYGYGWMVRDVLGDELVGHGGSIAVSTAYTGFLREAGLGVAVACNAAPETHPMHVGPALLAIARGEDPAALPAVAFRRKLDAVTGRYGTYRGLGTATVEREGARLTLTMESDLGDRELPLFPEGLDPDDLRFYTVAPGGERLPVTFEEAGDGLDLFVERNRFHRED